MTKTVSTIEVRKHLGDILNRVALRHDQFIIERNGKPMAAVIPVWQFEQWKEKREAFFSMIDKVRQRNRRMSQRTLEKETSEAIAFAKHAEVEQEKKKR